MFCLFQQFCKRLIMRFVFECCGIDSSVVLSLEEEVGEHGRRNKERFSLPSNY